MIGKKYGYQYISKVDDYEVCGVSIWARKASRYLPRLQYHITRPIGWNAGTSIGITVRPHDSEKLWQDIVTMIWRLRTFQYLLLLIIGCAMYD